MNLIGTFLVYAGLVALLFGVASVVRPLTFIGITSRRHGVFVLLCGVSVFLVGANLPASEKGIAACTSLLDDFVPAYQFGEFHTIRIKAPRERVYAAIRDVTPNEITLFQTLTWIRRFGRSGKESILNAPPNEPILALALRTSFMKLAEEPNREIVFGTLAAAPKGTRLKKSLRRIYWRVIYPGSALIRVMWLRAIGRREGKMAG